MPFGVRALNVKNRHVGLDRGDVQQPWFTGTQPWVALDQVGTKQRSRWQVRHAHGGGEQSEAHREVRMLLELQAIGDPLLDGAAVVVAEAGTDISDPGGGDPSHAARTNELVEEHVRDRPDELQLAPTLPNQGVSRRERDQRFERGAHYHRCSVWHESLDGFVQPLELHRLTEYYGRALLSCASQPTGRKSI